MEKRIVQANGLTIAVLTDSGLLITDAQSALDLIATIRYNDECDRVAIYKHTVDEAFFDLSTRIAGEILQKFVNYSMKLAIIGDFSAYTSKALRDFIYECNNGNAIFFTADETEAVAKLSTTR